MASTDPFKAPDTDIWQGVRITVNDVNIYRSNVASPDEIIGTSNIGYECVATKLSPDKKFYYLPYYGGWISVDNVQLMSERISTQFDEKTLINNVSNDTVPDDFGPDPLVTTDAYQAATSRGLDLAKYVLSTDGVFAMPYQFMSRVDRRLNDDMNGVGRKYAEKIISRNNLLYLTPGKQEFMAGAPTAEKEAVLDALINGGGAANSSSFYGRYYSLKFALDEYYDYVNPMCWSTAGLLDLSKVRMPDGSTLGGYHWSKYLNSQFGTYAKAGNNMLFYVDSFNEASEDFGNDTRESSLVSTINGYADNIKEVNYIMNYQNGEIGAMADSNGAFNAMRTTIQNTIDTFAKGKGVLQALLGNSTTILAGGKLVFPEMWGDSSFDRSFTVNIKLRSPDSDPLSIYLNIIVPFIHLIALTAPRNFLDNSNGYISPFLVRAYFRGIMNIDLGIVTGLSVTRGGEGNWSLDNLPTSVDVSLTIKDLYKSMYLADGGLKDAKFIGNDGEVDYLMNLAGINIAQESFQRRATIAGAVYGGQFKSLGARIGVELETQYINLMDKIYGYFGGR